MDNNRVQATWLHPDFDNQANRWIQNVIEQSGNRIVGKTENVKKNRSQSYYTNPDC